MALRQFQAIHCYVELLAERQAVITAFLLIDMFAFAVVSIHSALD